jgi:MarR family transcriptional regulator for hemolysin
MEMTRSDIERALAVHMAPLARAWRQQADWLLASLGVSNSSGWALVHMDRLGPGVRQGDLAREIEIREASLVPTLNQLEASGLIERRTDPKDRRANNLHLTSDGISLARQIEARLAGLRSELLADVPSGDIEIVLRVFDALGDKFAARRSGR